MNIINNNADTKQVGAGGIVCVGSSAILCIGSNGVMLASAIILYNL